MRRTMVAFLAVLAFFALATPLTAEAQQPGKVYRIGVLANAPPTTSEVSRSREAFRQGLVPLHQGGSRDPVKLSVGKRIH